MARVTSSLLVLLFLLSGIVPLFPTSAAEAKLPACCRQGGRHHCMGSMQPAAQSGDALTARPPDCPFRPRAVSPSSQSDLSLYRGNLPEAAVLASSGVVAQADSQYRIAQVRARQKRGPPTRFL